MSDVDYLRARLDEQEAEARSAIANRERAAIHPSDKGLQMHGPVDASDDDYLGSMSVGPEWVLADVAAKRAILELVGDEYPHVVRELLRLYVGRPDFPQ